MLLYQEARRLVLWDVARMSTDPERDRVLEKIAGLFRLAEGEGTTAAESATAAATAQRLLERYKLTRADLGVREKPSVGVGGLCVLRTLPKWLYILADGVAKVSGCLVYQQTLHLQGKPPENTIVVVGAETDRRVVEYTFTYLRREIERITKRALAETRIWGRSQANQYRIGAVYEVVARLRVARAEVRQTATSTALAVINRDEADVVNFFKALDTKRTEFNPIQRQNMDVVALAQGRNDARGIAITPGLEDGTSEAKLAGRKA